MKFILTDREIETMEARCQERADKKAVDEYKKTEDAKRMAFNEKQAELDALMAARGKCAVHFNFNDPNVVVFSVERVDHNTDKERTIVGYYLKAEAIKNGANEEKAIKEWSLLCSREQHNDLVDLFNEAKAGIPRKNETGKKQLLQG